MRIDDETVRAAHASRELIRLYDAYRATARAQIAAIQQVRRHLNAAVDRRDPARAIALAWIHRREALAMHTDAVYAERREQVRRRLHELQDIPEQP
jgi:hypothetical protein